MRWNSHINTHSLAMSLGVSAETARRHVNRLVADGLCVKSSLGVIVPTAVLQSPTVVRADEVHWRSFWRMIGDLRKIGFDFDSMSSQLDDQSYVTIEPGWALSGNELLPKQLVARIVRRFYLEAIIGASIPFENDWTLCAVFAAIMSANITRIAQDPQAAWRFAYADTPPPDNLRRGVTVHDAAERLGLPQETARRQIQFLLKQGRIERAEDGLLANMAYMQSDESRRSAQEMTKAFYRMIASLEALQVDTGLHLAIS